jgi:hypothetical protein
MKSIVPSYTRLGRCSIYSRLAQKYIAPEKKCVSREFFRRSASLINGVLCVRQHPNIRMMRDDVEAVSWWSRFIMSCGVFGRR